MTDALPIAVSAPLPASGRLLSLDAFRGTVMLLLVTGSLGLRPDLLLGFWPQSGFWQAAAQQWTHASYEGCFLWDLIQPAFMFIVGVSVPFSYAKRRSRGESYPQMLRHATYRGLALVLLGVLLRLAEYGMYFTFEDVIAQIGLGYVFVFLLWDRPRWLQAAAVAGILLAYWALWRYWPAIATACHVPGHATAGWPKEGNPGQAFDVWLRNTLPYNKPFRNHAYYTLNFIPSIATMAFGLMAGELLQSPLRPWRKFGWLFGLGLLGMGAGLMLDLAGVCPLIKKIWTPSWTLFSGGACLLLLAVYYALVDLWGWRRWTLPAVVLGANSIAVYVLLELYGGWMMKTINQQGVHRIVPSISVAWAAAITSVLAVGMFWLVFYVLYRSKVFVRI